MTRRLLVLLLAGLGAAEVSAADRYGCRYAAYTDAQGLIRVVWGCRDEREVATTEAGTYYAAMLSRVAALLNITAKRGAISPMVLPQSQAWEDGVTLCDRYQLWAEDEGARAPAMTRQAKIVQACR